MTETLATMAPSTVQENPLLRPWQTPFETPPFDEIRPEHFLPAFEQAFADHSAEIAAITHDPAAPDFANTITALERSGKLLTRVSAVFYDLVSAHSNPAILEIDKEVSPRMARHWNPIMMNAVLFGRIAMLHEKRQQLGLTGEQMRLLERTYTRFHRAGAGLDETAKARMAEINERLAQLGTSFSNRERVTNIVGRERGTRCMTQQQGDRFLGRTRAQPAQDGWRNLPVGLGHHLASPMSIAGSAASRRTSQSVNPA